MEKRTVRRREPVLTREDALRPSSQVTAPHLREKRHGSKWWSPEKRDRSASRSQLAVSALGMYTMISHSMTPILMNSAATAGAGAGLAALFASDDVVAQQGQKGEKGQPGMKGGEGAQGEQGMKGEKGDVGPQGNAGRKGWTGDPGEKGDKGDAGRSGSPGAPGDPGPKGDPGAKGGEGAPGTPGAKGEVGEQGAAGPKGEVGEQGAAGAKGAQGEQGTAGAKGAQGEQGIQGVKGDIGPSGGPQGDKGATGEKGEQGTAGAPGATGAQGAAGPRGATGATGATGAQGAKGDTGQKGGFAPIDADQVRRVIKELKESGNTDHERVSELLTKLLSELETNNRETSESESLTLLKYAADPNSDERVRTAAVYGSISANEREIRALNAKYRALRSENREGTAVALALGGIYLPKDKDNAINMRFGHFEGESALAAAGAFRINENWWADFGVAYGLRHNQLGYSGGVTFSW